MTSNGMMRCRIARRALSAQPDTPGRRAPLCFAMVRSCPPRSKIRNTRPSALAIDADRHADDAKPPLYGEQTSPLDGQRLSALSRGSKSKSIQTLERIYSPTRLDERQASQEEADKRLTNAFTARQDSMSEAQFCSATRPDERGLRSRATYGCKAMRFSTSPPRHSVVTP